MDIDNYEISKCQECENGLFPECISASTLKEKFDSIFALKLGQCTVNLGDSIIPYLKCTFYYPKCISIPLLHNLSDLKTRVKAEADLFMQQFTRLFKYIEIGERNQILDDLNKMGFWDVYDQDTYYKYYNMENGIYIIDNLSSR